jgi:hypothetical protein
MTSFANAVIDAPDFHTVLRRSIYRPGRADLRLRRRGVTVYC